MRVVLDTNILVSALIVTGTHLEEFRRVTRYPRLRKYIRPAAAGTMLNEIRALAEMTGELPNVSACTDPADNFLLAMAEAGQADFLVTGDERHLLSLKRHKSTRILSAREMVQRLE